jgi:uncharacterized protein YtpQ (UPF0354 family)
MSLIIRMILRSAAVVSITAVVCLSADAKEHGIPKSAPAFAKFVARFIQEAAPEARVSVSGRLRLEVETPNGGNTTDLHNIYSTCRKDPDNCDAELTNFVAGAIQVYRSAKIKPLRDKLRIVIRPYAYIGSILSNPKRDKPIAVHLVGDDWILVVIDEEKFIAYLDETELPSVALTAKTALAAAFANTRERLQKSLQDELRNGPCRGIMGGDIYTASIAAFPDLWAAAARQKCHGDLLIAVPASDVVVFADGTYPDAVKTVAGIADGIMAKEGKPFSDAVFRWTPNGWIVAQGPSAQVK